MTSLTGRHNEKPRNGRSGLGTFMCLLLTNPEPLAMINWRPLVITLTGRHGANGREFHAAVALKGGAG
jgi:hypothetical protein